MAILWWDEPCPECIWKPHVAKLWEQHAPKEAGSQKWGKEHVGDTWEFLRAEVTAAYQWYGGVVPNLFILLLVYQEGSSTHTLYPFDGWDSMKEWLLTFLLQDNHGGCGTVVTHVNPLGLFIFHLNTAVNVNVQQIHFFDCNFNWFQNSQRNYSTVLSFLSYFTLKFKNQNHRSSTAVGWYKMI